MRGIILDTNVVSDPRRPNPSSRVRAWMDAQDVGRLYLTAITVGEIALGTALLAPGRKRVELEVWLDLLLTEKFAQRVLPYDADAARALGPIVARARSLGRSPATADAQIAAVATHHRLAIATRNVRDFEALGVPLINPWDESARTEAQES